jgi:hypothetical protein
MQNKVAINTNIADLREASRIREYNKRNGFSSPFHYNPRIVHDVAVLGIENPKPVRRGKRNAGIACGHDQEPIQKLAERRGPKRDAGIDVDGVHRAVLGRADVDDMAASGERQPARLLDRKRLDASGLDPGDGEASGAVVHDERTVGCDRQVPVRERDASGLVSW